jgi:hypothetical protein
MLPSVTTAVPVAPPNVDPTGAGQASQNLFENMAQQSTAAMTGASPAQLGAGVLENLEGFFTRTQRFAERAANLGGAAQPPIPAGPGQAAASTPGADPQLQKVVESLSLMFDHSIETQMVVRGATQVSGAANTLLKGQ